MMRFLCLTAALLLSSGCTTAAATSVSVAAPDSKKQGAMNQDILDRFPGAVVLDEREFASAIVGRAFHHREVGTELVIERPSEFFGEGGRYSVGHRAIAHGTYSIERGTVSIDCSDCPSTIFGLGRHRVFFRHQGRLFTTNADGEGSVIELIPYP